MGVEVHSKRHAVFGVECRSSDTVTPQALRGYFGEHVILKGDMYFLMGKDQAELKRLTAGVAWAVQNEPWRLEIDRWNSFVNVDVTFLDGLTPLGA